MARQNLKSLILTQRLSIEQLMAYTNCSHVTFPKTNALNVVISKDKTKDSKIVQGIYNSHAFTITIKQFTFQLQFETLNCVQSQNT